MCFSLTLCSFYLKYCKGEVLCETTTCVFDWIWCNFNFDVLQVVLYEIKSSNWIFWMNGGENKVGNVISLMCAISVNYSSSSYICHGVGSLVDPFRSHVSRSLFKVEYCFITLGNLLRGILFTCCIKFLLYSSNLSKIGVIFNSFVICVFV